MALNGAQHEAGFYFPLYVNLDLTAALTAVVSTPVTGLAGMKYLGATGVFTVVGGGTTAKVWIQTSFNNGSTWFDIMNFAYTTSTLTKVGAVGAYVGTTAPATPTDGSLADNTATQGLLGDRLRVKVTTTGTFTTLTSLVVTCIAKG